MAATNKLHILSVWLEARADNGRQLSRSVRLRNECRAQKLPLSTEHHNFCIGLYLRCAKVHAKRLREAASHGLI